MISVEELRQKMADSGCPVTVRQLTDWRSKGLLPPLESMGRGKGRGRIYFWTDPKILVCAQFVHHAFTHGATAEIVTLSLMHGGFNVETKTARRTWIKILTKLEGLSEKRVEPGEPPRDAFWDQALQIAPKLSDRGNISIDVLEPLIAEALVTIYARRGFRPSPEELGDISDAFKQYLTAIMAAPRFRGIHRLFSRKKWVKRFLELIRRGLSVSATRELIKGTNAVQFDLAISATRQMVRLVEALIAAQMQGKTQADPILEIRMIFRAILGAPITAFFLQLIGEGYERKLRKSMRLAEEFISSCETNSGQQLPPQKPELPQQLQEVSDRLISEFEEIWRDFSLFRLYHIA